MCTLIEESGERLCKGPGARCSRFGKARRVRELIPERCRTEFDAVYELPVAETDREGDHGDAEVAYELGGKIAR